jgi:hypothetical protein
MAAEARPSSPIDTDDLDSLPSSDASSTSIDSVDHDRLAAEAEEEWKESLQQLELLLTMVIVPYAGKYFGRDRVLTPIRMGQVHGMEVSSGSCLHQFKDAQGHRRDRSCCCLVNASQRSLHSTTTHHHGHDAANRTSTNPRVWANDFHPTELYNSPPLLNSHSNCGLPALQLQGLAPSPLPKKDLWTCRCHLLKLLAAYSEL